jgi:omega-amidase
VLRCVCMKLALIQYAISWEDKRKNQERILAVAGKNASGADLMVFPEMTLTGYSLHASQIAEEEYGESFEFFSTLAIKAKCDIIYGCVLREGDRFYNTLHYVDLQGKQLAIYKKIHPFSFAKEDKVYTGGDNPVILNKDGMNIGFSICYDLRFPELFRHYAKNRVDLIINIANWPSARKNHWDILTQSRAIENLAYVAAVNRCGNDPYVPYGGGSVIVDPFGETISAAKDGEEILIADIDKAKVDEIRNSFPFLNDIRLF